MSVKKTKYKKQGPSLTSPVSIYTQTLNTMKIDLPSEQDRNSQFYNNTLLQVFESHKMLLNNKILKAFLLMTLQMWWNKIE